jgi:hypothetical protein
MLSATCVHCPVQNPVIRTNPQRIPALCPPKTSGQNTATPSSSPLLEPSLSAKKAVRTTRQHCFARWWPHGWSSLPLSAWTDEFPFFSKALRPQGGKDSQGAARCGRHHLRAAYATLGIEEGSSPRGSNPVPCGHQEEDRPDSHSPDPDPVEPT